VFWVSVGFGIFVKIALLFSPNHPPLYIYIGSAFSFAFTLAWTAEIGSKNIKWAWRKKRNQKLL